MAKERPKLFFKRILLALALTVGFALPSLGQEHPDGIHVHDAYARVSGGQGAAGAVFFTIHNNSVAAITILTASTPLAAKAGLHRHQESAEGVMQMLEIEGGVPLAPGEMHVFERGGDHIMLMGLTEALADGDTIALTLSFDGAEPMTFDAVVDNTRKPGNAADHAHPEPSPTGG
jgi:copper(I)-binding protein